MSTEDSDENILFESLSWGDSLWNWLQLWFNYSENVRKKKIVLIDLRLLVFWNDICLMKTHRNNLWAHGVPVRLVMPCQITNLVKRLGRKTQESYLEASCSGRNILKPAAISYQHYQHQTPNQDLLRYSDMLYSEIFSL